uniref:Uncharacterized protein n=1 Tax=Panagrolaimus superbus TaxID=310955 RepID=A0A914YWW6_9BILA
MKKEITKKENTITELTLQVGKQAANDDKIIKELKKERDVVNAKNTTLTEELNELKKQNQTNLRSIERLENEKKREVDDLNDKLRKRNGDIDKVNSEKSNLDFERRQLEEKVQTLERELRTKSTAIDDANDEIANMKSTIDNWQMEYNTNTNELENHYQTQMQQFDQHLRDCNDEITSLRNRLENNVEEKRQYEKQHNLDLTNLKEANTEKSKLQQENIELKKMLEDNSNAEDTMLSQIAQYNRETDNLNLSLNQSFEKIKNLELCLATPNLRFINLNQAFKNYTRGQNVKIGDDNSLREILLYSYPEIFPDPDLSQNTETGCIPNENLLSGQQNIECRR